MSREIPFFRSLVYPTRFVDRLKWQSIKDGHALERYVYRSANELRNISTGNLESTLSGIEDHRTNYGDVKAQQG